MGYQSGINQLLGMVAAGGYLVNKELQPKLEESRMDYRQASDAEKEHYNNMAKPVAAQRAEKEEKLAEKGQPVKRLPDKLDFIETPYDDNQLGHIGASGGIIGKLHGINHLKDKAAESFSNMQERDKIIWEIKKQQQKENLGRAHMQQKGQKKVKQRMTFNKFYKNLKDNPPELYGEKNTFNRLSSKAQEQIAKKLYSERKK